MFLALTIEGSTNTFIATMAKATVTAVVIPDSGRPETILLTRRTVAPFMGSWCLPGGHIDEYERADDAVRREVLEETGLVFEPCGCLGWFEEIFPEHRFHAIVLAFYGTGAGILRPQPGEVSDIGWFSVNETLAMPLAFNHNQVIQRYAEQLHR
jgi:8-oxo-dGTP diphosphatase